MSSLRELQQRFADTVLSSEIAPSFAGSSSFARDRIGIYRRTIFSNYRKALVASFPVVKRLTGEAFFDAAVDAFVRARPSKSGDLNIYGADFGDFLSDYAPAAELPYLADVARLEWAIDGAHRASDASNPPESVLARLATANPERLSSLRLELNPSCRLLGSRFPILHIWQTNQPNYIGDDRVSLDEGADALLVRRGTDGVSIERIAPGVHAWLLALDGEATLADSIEAAQRVDATFDLKSALREHIAAGTIISVIDR